MRVVVETKQKIVRDYVCFVGKYLYGIVKLKDFQKVLYVVYILPLNNEAKIVLDEDYDCVYMKKMKKKRKKKRVNQP